MFDAHIHMYYGPSDTPKEFLAKTAAANITGGNIFSVPTEQTIGRAAGDYRWEARLEHVLEFTSQTPGFYPFYRFDPTSADIEKQLHTAVERGCKGFKVICEKYYPEDCLRACSIIAETGMPIMFHSGVLDGGRDMLCNRFNHPSAFEILFSVRKLRFSLAHLGWPWMDDYMAMVAKSCFTNNYEPDFQNRMYFDLTPGTPGINREDGLRKLYLTGYGVKNFVLWGSDGTTNNYDPELPQYWEKRDRVYMEKIEQDADAYLPPGVPDLRNIFHLATEENWKDFDRIPGTF